MQDEGARVAFEHVPAGEARQRHPLFVKRRGCRSLLSGDPNGGGAGRKSMMAQCEESLRRLQTGYIDLYWMHCWDANTPIEETMRGFDDLVRSGKVRYIGIPDTKVWRVTQAQMMARFRGWGDSAIQRVAKEQDTTVARVALAWVATRRTVSVRRSGVAPCFMRERCGTGQRTRATAMKRRARDIRAGVSKRRPYVAALAREWLRGRRGGRVGELLSGGDEQRRTRGMSHPEANGFEHEESGESLSVTEALDGDLDAYLDRELALEPDVDGDGAHASTREAAEDMRALLDLAEEETRWIAESPQPSFSDAEPDETVSESAPVVIPEWMRANPEVPVAEPVRLPWEHSKVVPPTVARGGAASRAASQKNTVNEVRGPLNLQQQPWGIPMVPPGQQWGGPMAPGQQYAWGGPVAAPTASNRRRDVVSGVLLGVAAVGALAAGMLVVASVRFWEQGASAPSVLGGVSASGYAVQGSTGTVVHGASSSAQLNGASNTGALMGMNASGQTGSAVSSGVAGHWGIPGVSTGTAEHPTAPQYTGPFVTTSPGSVSDVANGLHAQGTSTDSTRAPTSISGPSGADLMARRDTLAVKSGERRTRTETAPTRAPANPTPPQSVAAASGAVMEMSFEEPDSDGVATSVPVDTADDPDGANSTESELDEEFARELGFTEEAEERAAAEPTATRTVYVPPALDAKEHLTPEDVKQVVVSNQPAITACLRQHAADTSMEKGGRFVVRWSVQPGGETTGVAMDTEALRATPLAGCIEGVVRGWKFPVHTVRMQELIRFPFVF